MTLLTGNLVLIAKAFTLAGAVVAMLASATGFYAAHLWKIASTVNIDPGWTVEPGETDASQAGWIGGIMTNIMESAERNSKAARLTGYAALMGAVSGLLGAVAAFCS